MKRNRRLIFVILLLVCLFGLLMVSTYLYITETRKQNQVSKISVIVYGSSTDRWATLKQGIEQGATDFGAEINFVTMKAEYDVDEQKMLIKREVENGANGIILAVADSARMSGAIRESALLLPIIMVETNTGNAGDMTYISADNYSMGLNIGRSVLLGSEENRVIAVYKNSFQRSSVKERYEGLIDSLQYAEYTLKIWENIEGAEEEERFLRNKLKQDPADVVIALDDRSLEAVADAALIEEITVDIYGIGSTNKIVHYLDYGIVKSIVFQNEFNMGYLSMREIMNDIQEKEKELVVEIEFRTVNRDTMYLPKNQRLVFPIIQ